MTKHAVIKWGLMGLTTLVMLIGIAMVATAAFASWSEDTHLAGRERKSTFTSPLPTETPHAEKTETPEARETPEVRHATETPEAEHETPEPRHTPEPEVHTPESAHAPEIHTPEPQHTPEPGRQAPNDDKPGHDKEHNSQPPKGNDNQGRSGKG